MKNKQIVIPMHHFVIKLPLEPFGIRLFAKKIKSDGKKMFLLENAVFILTFAIGLIKKLEFLDSTG